MEKSILQTLAEFIEILEKTSISDVEKKRLSKNLVCLDWINLPAKGV